MEAPEDLLMVPWQQQGWGNTTFKHLSERLFAQAVANTKQVEVQGLFVVFYGKHFDNSFMAMSNGANSISSR